METPETTFTDGQFGTYPEFDCSGNAHENATQSGSQKGLEHSTHEDLIAQTNPLSCDRLRLDLTTVESQLDLELTEIPVSNISGERSIPTLASTEEKTTTNQSKEKTTTDQSKEKTTTDQSEEKVNTSIFDQSDERNVNIDLVESTNKPINNISEEQSPFSLKISEISLETQKLQDMDVQKSNAVIIYRWSKTLVTKCEDIGFYPSYEPDNPILLSWNENVQAYFSSELRVVCGDYHGNLIVDGKICPVEEFSIRTYTFEVDLFMKDAPEEKATSHSELKETSYEQHLSSGQTFMDPDSVDTSRTYTISSANVGKQAYQVTQEVDQLLKHKMVEDDVLKDNAQEKFMSSSLKSNGEIPLAGMKRDSPVGNADAGKFLESSFQRQEHFEPSDDRFTLQDLRTSVEGPVSSSPRDPGMSGLHSVLTDESARLNMRSQSRGSSGSAVGSQTGGGLRGSRPPSVGADSDHGSLKHSLSNDALYSRHEAKASDRFSPDSLRSGDSPSLATEKHKSLSDQVSVRSSIKDSSALVNEAISYKEGATHLSGIVHSLSRVTPNRDLADDGMFGSKKRFIENRDSVSPSSSISGRPPTHPSIRSGSLQSSRSESLLSITSEHELTGYFEQSRSQHTGHLSLSSSVNYDKSSRASSNTKLTDRSPSVPNWTSQISSDRRSITPDIRSQVPIPSGETEERVRDIHSSSSPASRVSSCVSSRTVTPVQAESGNRTNTDERIKELEASVTNLRKLLASRESEVHSLTSQLEDMRDINRSLRDELDHRGRRHTPVNSLQESFEYKQLQSEKEILVSEVVALRDELQRFNKGQPFSSGRNKAGPGISDYSPNSPTVLVRKIGDLEAHIRDLQEVSETTNSSLVETERKLKLLQNENRELKSGSITAAASQAQSDHDLRVELRTLREDIRNLKERNYQLTEENMQLQDGQKGVSKEIHSSGGGSRLAALRSGDRQLSGYSTNAALAHEFSLPSYGGIAGNRPSSASLIAPKKVSHEDLAPKDLRQSSVNQAPVNERDPLTNEYRHHQHRTISDSSRLWLQPRETTARSKSTESSSKSLQYLDRSKPDGEVSEKSYHDSFIRPLPRETHDSFTRPLPHETHEDRRRERESYGDKHSSYRPHLSRESTEFLIKDKFDVEDKDDKYRYLNGGLHESVPRTGTIGRLPSSGLQLNSRDIYLSLQQKRASQRPPRDNKYISGNLDLHRYQPHRVGADNAADDSDTATDILLTQDSTPRGPPRHRRTSLGSDGSPASFSDGEDTADSLLRRRSKSVDVKRGQSRQVSSLSRSESASRSLATTENVHGSAGFRSVIPAPLVTQHNKGEVTSRSMTSLLSSSLTQGLRPFAPRSPADIRVEDVVKFSRPGGKLTQGVVKYVGHLPGRNEAYLGVELDKDEGKHDGTFEGVRFFKCKPNKGVFVAFNKIVMAWAP